MPLFKFSPKRLVPRYFKSKPPPESPIFFYPYRRPLTPTEEGLGLDTDMAPMSAPTDANESTSVALIEASEETGDVLGSNSMHTAVNIDNENDYAEVVERREPLIAEFDYHSDSDLDAEMNAFWQELRAQGYIVAEDDVIMPEEHDCARNETDSFIRIPAGRDSDVSSATGDDEIPPPRHGPLKDRARPHDNTPFEESIAKILLGTVSGIVRAYNAISWASCGCISVPTSWVNNFAFFPPSPFKHYYLSYIDSNTGERVIGNAEVAYGQRGIRIEPVVDKAHKNHIKNVRRFAKRTETFIVASDSGNFIVMVKVYAERPPNAPKNHKVILLANSNASDLGISFDTCLGVFLTDNHPNDYDFYMFDYSGYGLSSGKPSEKAVYADIRAVYAHILREQNDPFLKVVLFGISIGTTVVADLAARNPPNLGGVVLVAPLTSGIRHIAGANPPKKTARSDVFRILDIAPKIRVPVLCVHGLADTMMPATNSAQIYAAVQKPVDPLYVPHASHLGVLFAPELVARFQVFIEEEIDADDSEFDNLCRFPASSSQQTTTSDR